MGRPTELIETPYGSYHSFAGDMTTQQLKKYGAHQRNELAMMVHLAQPGDTVIDVGGHIGTFCIPLARKVAPAGKVYAFEPLDEHIELLGKNAAANSVAQNLEVVRAIVTDTPGRYAVKSAGANTGSTIFRLDPAGDGPAIDCLSLDQWRQRERKSGALSGPVHILKIDVEGMELNVLRSGKQLLSQDQPILYFEIARAYMADAGNSIDELNDLLKNLGYHFFLNVGERNSSSDEYRLGQFTHLVQGGHFFDVLAIPPGHPRYPQEFDPAATTVPMLNRKRLKAALSIRRFKKFIRKCLGLKSKSDAHLC